MSPGADVPMFEACHFERSEESTGTTTRGKRARGFFAALRMTGVVVGLSSGCLAADDNTVISPRSAARPDTPAAAASGGALHSMSLLVGLALAGAGGWLVWRNRRGTPAGRDQRALAVEETRSLGNRQYLVVASYEGKKFLLGVCPGRIDLLSPLGEAPIAREKSRE